MGTLSKSISRQTFQRDTSICPRPSQGPKRHEMERGTQRMLFALCHTRVYIYSIYLKEASVALSLKNAELEKLARRRARRRGETLTDAILSALQESERSAARMANKVTAGEILRLAGEFGKLPMLSARSEEEILG